jgi:hypothetical protein
VPNSMQADWHFRQPSPRQNTFIIPDESEVNYPIRTCLSVRQGGDGQVIFAKRLGSTLVMDGPGFYRTAGKGSAVTAMKVGTNTWDIIGDVQYGVDNPPVHLFKNWDDNSVADQLMFGLGAPTQSAASGNLVVVPGSNEAKIRMTALGNVTNGYIDGIVKFGAGGTVGFLWRSSLGAATDEYAYAGFINISQAVIRKGGQGGFTPANLGTFAHSLGNNVNYRLRVEFQGAVFKLYVNNVLRINVQDGFYHQPGFCGLFVAGAQCEFNDVAFTVS